MACLLKTGSDEIRLNPCSHFLDAPQGFSRSLQSCSVRLTFEPDSDGFLLLHSYLLEQLSPGCFSLLSENYPLASFGRTPFSLRFSFWSFYSIFKVQWYTIVVYYQDVSVFICG